MLLTAGHTVLGIDQSGSMLARAREHFPQARFPGLRYTRIGLQEMDFQSQFNGVICIEALGLPVVFGEVADELDAVYAQAIALDALDRRAISGEKLDLSVYHYHPSMEQVRVWFNQAGLVIEEEGTGDGYEHLLMRKKA